VPDIRLFLVVRAKQKGRFFLGGGEIAREGKRQAKPGEFFRLQPGTVAGQRPVLIKDSTRKKRMTAVRAAQGSWALNPLGGAWSIFALQYWPGLGDGGQLPRPGLGRPSGVDQPGPRYRRP